jgi:hypothetical protein
MRLLCERLAGALISLALMQSDGDKHAHLKRGISSLILTALLWAVALAASPGLHEWAHGEDTGHDEHECAATLIATGGCEPPGAAPVPLVAPAAFELAALLPGDFKVPVIFLVSGTLEHGPPVAGA